MAQPVELKISLRRGISGTGETTEAEVAMSFKLGKADSDLGSLVESKFHEVKKALVNALESEDPGQAGEAAGTEVEEPEDLSDWTPAAPATQPATGENAETVEGRAIPVAANSLQETEQAENFEPPNPGANERASPHQGEEILLITPAQKRTIQSLCASAGIDARQLRIMLESGYNRQNLDSLGRREAGSLIFRLSQKQRESMLRDKSDAQPSRFHLGLQKEAINQNGVSQ